jgi:hypothetical protein
MGIPHTTIFYIFKRLTDVEEEEAEAPRYVSANLLSCSVDEFL